MDASGPKQDEFGGRHWKSDQVHVGEWKRSRGSTRTEPPGGSMPGVTKEARGQGGRAEGGEKDVRLERSPLEWSAGW